MPINKGYMKKMKVKSIILKKIFLYPILFFGLFPNINNLDASQDILKNDVANWFKDDY